MAALTPSKRGQFLSRVLGYEKLRIAQDLTRDRRNRVKAAIEGCSADCPIPKQFSVSRGSVQPQGRSRGEGAQAAHRGAVRQREMMAIEPRWEMAQKQREQSAQLLTQITVAEEKEAALNRDAQRIAREVDGISAAHEQLDNLR